MSTQTKSKKMKQQTIISMISRGVERLVSTEGGIPVDDKLSLPSSKNNSESSWTPSRIRKSSVLSGASDCSDEECLNV